MKKPRPYVSRVMVIVFLCLLSGTFALSQSATATLSGTVVDPNGAILPGATVTITNPATGFSREAVANNDGAYTFPSLAPGRYTVMAQQAGFSRVEIRDVVLNVNDKLLLRVQLPIGDVNAVVQVDSQASLVDESPAVATTVDRTLLGDLPLPGRSFQGLIALAPGVVIDGATVSDQGQFSVNGQRRSSNAFYIDGVSGNFGGASGANFGQVAGGSLPAFSAQGGTNSLVSVDAVQEFTILTSTYAAEFGRQPGAQISILTRSGTNAFTGSVFEYFRNDALDANDFFNNRFGLEKPPLRLNQFGGVLGGPIYLPRFGEGGPALWSGKDRTFFFFSYEGLRLIQPQNRQTDVPSLTARQNAPAAVRPFLDAFPLPNGPVNAIDPNIAEFNSATSEPSDLNTYGIRVDHHFGSSLQIFGRYSDSRGSNVQRATPLEGLAASNFLDTAFSTRTLTFGAISPFSSKLVNDFRFNYSTHETKSTAVLDNFGGAIPFSAAQFFTTPQPFDEENALFFFQIANGRNMTLASGTNTTNTQRQLNIVNHLSVVNGGHSLKFGVDYRRLSPSFAPRDYVAAAIFFDVAGVISPPNPANPLIGPLATQFQQSNRGDFFFNNLGLYAQDTWRVSRRLALTLGLRWDLDLPPTLGGGVDPFAVTSAGFDDLSQLALAPPGTKLYEASYDGFAPRIGISYLLREKAGQETVLRGGFGIFNDLASQYAGQIAQVNFPPFGASRTIRGPLIPPGVDPTIGPPVFPIPPNQAAPPPFTVTFPLFGMTFINPELKAPYSFHWNAAVEQSLGNYQTVSVSYVASRGYRLLQQESISGVVNPTFSSPVLIDNTADSQYDSMQVQFQRRLTRGLQALASYTWAHSIDTASTAGFSSTNSFSRSRPEDNRGDSDFDIRHTFNAAVSYNIPAPFKNDVLRAILGGWSADTIFISRTAPPVTIITSGLTAPLETAVIRPDFVPGVPLYIDDAAFPGGRRINPAAFTRPPTELVGGIRRPLRQGTVGRNSLRGFGAWQVDFALRREIKLGDRLRMQLRGDFFNVFNHPNFGSVNRTLVFNAAGQVTNLATFGLASSMLGRSLGGGGLGGGFSPLFQIGGPRSTQLSVKLLF